MINLLKKIRYYMFRFLLQKVVKKDSSLLLPPSGNVGKCLKSFGRIFTNPYYLESILIAPISFQLLRSALKLKLIDLLHEQPGQTAKEISQNLKLDIYPLNILVLGLSSLHIINKIGDRYYNDPLLSLALLENSNNNLIPKMLDYMHTIVGPAMNHLEESVRQNEPHGLWERYGKDTDDFYTAISQNPEHYKCFNNFMSCMSDLNLKKVVKSGPFHKCKYILDIGGNIGNLSIELANIHPNAEITLLDNSEVIKKAQKRFNTHPSSSRLKVVAGNILKDPIPKGFDCIILSHFIDIFSQEVNQDIFRKIYSSLNTNGYLCAKNSTIDANEDGPVIQGVFSSYFFCLANGQGQTYSIKKIKSWFTNCNFKEIKVVHLPAQEAMIIGKKSE
jgi:ubiquinone/menaquinone biosynthesis C-methylase UbiE